MASLVNFTDSRLVNKGQECIQFADPEVKRILVENWGGADGGTAANNTRVGGKKVKGKAGEMTYKQAASVINIGAVFYNNTDITSFDEFQYFTNIQILTGNNFNGCTNLASIIIPNNVTRLNDSVFYNCTSLVNIVIPDNVTYIGKTVFYGCSSLVSVTLPNGLANSYIHFSRCTNLKRVNSNVDGIANIPSGVTNVGFYSCESLTHINLPNTVTSLSNETFRHCTNLVSIDIPSTVTTIGASCFYDCISLTNITLPSGVTSIEHRTFQNCSSLESITMSNNVTKIWDYAFQSCESLKRLNSDIDGVFNLPSSLTTVGHSLLSSCKQAITVNFPSGITTNSNGSLVSSCTKLEVVNNLPVVTGTNNYAFFNCTNLKRVNSNTDGTCIIPEGTVALGTQAMVNCKALTVIDLPSTITSIGSSGIGNCILDSLIVRAAVPPTVSNNSFLYTSLQHIYVPAASVDAYKAADGWSTYASKIEAIPS